MAAASETDGAAAGAANNGQNEQREGEANNNNNNEQQQPQFNFMSILNWILFFWITQNIAGMMTSKLHNRNDMTKMAPGNTAGEQQIKKPLGVDPTAATDTINNEKMKKMNRMAKPVCLWPQGTMMDLDVIISDSANVPNGWPDLTTNTGKDDKNENGDDDREEGTILASWSQTNLILGGKPHQNDPSNTNNKATTTSVLSSVMGSNTNQEMNHRNATLTVSLTDRVWNNETHVYAWVRLRRHRYNRSTSNSGGVANSTGDEPPSRKDDVLVKRMVLTRHRKRKRIRDEKSLLEQKSSDGSKLDNDSGGEQQQHDTSILTQASLNKTHDQILLYIKPTLTLQFVDLGKIDLPGRHSMPKQFADHMDWYDGENNELDGNGWFYYPILYNSEFWISYKSLKEVNGTMKASIVDISVEPVPMWKWQLQSGMVDNQRKQESFTGEEDDSNDMIRTMLLETNPYLLVVTAIVSVLHTVFDILAFKNDISFFKNKKSMEGLSLRSMIVNAFFSLVILLYLADNDTSFMVLMSNGVGLVIEVWKISKAITIKWEGGKIEWVEAQSYKKSKTKEYDEIATSHLLFVTMPLVAGYGLYSLYYQKHKGWYSWILNTLVGFIYMFGFVMMTPQLFINYKLQSVAHLNWRTMSYKSINTFIDDLFAFVIKMPIMHRLACLRDDVIFFIFLYQRYKYKVDYTRLNEFGQCTAPTEEMIAEREEEQAQVETENVPSVDEQPSGVRRRRGAREKKND